MKLRDQYVVFLQVICFCGSSCGEGDIRKPPTITRHPSAIIIYRVDSTFTLECKAEGVPAVSYEWKKNGIELNQNLPNIQRGVDGTIIIQPATSMDEGFYQCFASNQYGTALSIITHIQRAVLEYAWGTRAVLQKTVIEGMPFHIQADPQRSFPKSTYGWEMATDSVDKNPIGLVPTKRMQIAQNGDLHFAYAIPDDALYERIYKCTTYNPYLDLKAGGSYTKLTVTRGALNPFPPTLGFASETETVAVIGGSVTLRCFFSGYPEPTISWTGPRNTLPIGRYTLASFSTELSINSITATDEGDYKCTGLNNQGLNIHTFQIRVEVAPIFRALQNRPRDVNVTEGKSLTLNCIADAKPEAAIVWFKDGTQLDPDNPPKRFVFNENKKSLTIRDVCRDCVDRETKTDLMVIQCNASNAHGYALAQGYLNVLGKTKVTLHGNATVLVNAKEEYEIQFNCTVSSDPSTCPTIRWFKIEQSSEKLVRDDPPFVEIVEGALTIRFNPDDTDRGNNFLGEYKCVGDNGYSRDFKTVKVIAIITATAATTQGVESSERISTSDTTVIKGTQLAPKDTETQTSTDSPVTTPSGMIIPGFWIWIVVAIAILLLLLLIFSIWTTVNQCRHKYLINDHVNKRANGDDFPTEPYEPDYETIDDDFRTSAQKNQSSLSPDSLPQGILHPRSDAYVSVGGVANLSPRPMRHTAPNKIPVMVRHRQELDNIPETSEIISGKTTEYVALAERPPKNPAVYAVLEQTEEQSPVRYTTFKRPERVKRIKSWFF